MSDSSAVTTDVLPEGGPGVERDAEPAPTRRRRGLGVTAWLSVIWLAVVVALALLAPVLPIDDPIDGLRNEAKLGFLGTDSVTGELHVFGTDDSGRDVLSRVIWGAQTSLMISVLSIGFGTLIGGLAGLVAGFIGGKVGTILGALFDILLAFPPLLLALTLVSVLSPVPQPGEDALTRMDRVWPVALAVGLVAVPILARISRANTLAWSQREFVMAAKAQGARPLRVMLRDVLPNVIPAMLSIALLGVATVIIVEGGLAIFGLSINPPDPSWGNMIASQVDGLDNAPNVWLAPSVVIFLTVLALNFLGDVVRDRFSVREAAI